MSPPAVARRGFALLTVLWVLAGMTVLGLLVQRTAADALETIANRSESTRSVWRAEGCLARVRASIDDELRDAKDPEEAWGALDQVVGEPAGCTIVSTPTGMRVDVNSASDTTLRAAFTAAGVTARVGDSLAAAILDWRDQNDQPLSDGAERSWYEARQEPTPRNGPFGADEELLLVRGLRERPEMRTLLSVEPGRVLLTRASAPVLESLPGITHEAAARIIEDRARGPLNLQLLSTTLSAEAGATLRAHIGDLQRLATMTPDAWVVSARVLRRAPDRYSSVQLRLVRSGRRAAVMRHRTLPWS